MQPSEEKINSITHGIGLILSIIAAFHLISISLDTESIRHFIAHVIYSFSMITLYLSSTIYHGTENKKIKPIFNILDHFAIFIFIAGTYTPFVLTLLWGHSGMILFGIVWLIGLLGIIYKVFFFKMWPAISVLLYLVAGWVGLAAIGPMLEYVPQEAINLMFGGGILYTIGVLFFVFDDYFRYFHAIWHIFVILGSLCHYIAVLLYTMP